MDGAEYDEWQDFSFSMNDCPYVVTCLSLPTVTPNIHLHMNWIIGHESQSNLHVVRRWRGILKSMTFNASRQKASTIDRRLDQ